MREREKKNYTKTPEGTLSGARGTVIKDTKLM